MIRVKSAEYGIVRVDDLDLTAGASGVLNERSTTLFRVLFVAAWLP